MIYYVHVGVSLARPPTIQEFRRYAVVADSDMEAYHTALLMASCTSIMPVWGEIVEVEE